MMRLVILCLSLMLALPLQAQEWAFKVYLDKNPIGEHTFRIARHDDTKALTSSARFNVKVLFINAYQYHHIAQERWQGDCLTALQARTEENKEITQVKGELTSGEFKVESTKGKLNLPTCIMTFAYWNPLMLKQDKLLNPQTGEWLDVNIKQMGTESIDVRGQQVQAERYRLEAPKMKIDLWYGKGQEWLALQSTTPEGYLITYKLK